jgi:hypothetical protein
LPNLDILFRLTFLRLLFYSQRSLSVFLIYLDSKISQRIVLNNCVSMPRMSNCIIFSTSIFSLGKKRFASFYLVIYFYYFLFFLFIYLFIYFFFLIFLFVGSFISSIQIFDDLFSLFYYYPFKKLIKTFVS